MGEADLFVVEVFPVFEGGVPADLLLVKASYKKVVFFSNFCELVDTWVVESVGGVVEFGVVGGFVIRSLRGECVIFFVVPPSGIFSDTLVIGVAG